MATYRFFVVALAAVVSLPHVNKSASALHLNKPQRHVSPYRNNTSSRHDIHVIIPRGGGGGDNVVDMNNVPSRGGGKRKKSKKNGAAPIQINEVKTTPLQNIIRSLLDGTKHSSPSLHKIIRQFVTMIQSVTGITLLPPSPKSTTTTKKKKKSKTCTETKGSSKTKKLAQRQQQPSKSFFTIPTSTSTKLSPDQRIQMELRKFLSAPPPNLTLKVGKNIRVWIITLTFPPSSIYHSETHKLRVAFPKQYPSVPPSVYFLPPTPRHEHVYTNGDICLSLLGKDWRPTMTAQSIALSIHSILNGAQSKSLPMDNAKHCGNKPGGRQDDWIYHDDNC